MKALTLLLVLILPFSAFAAEGETQLRDEEPLRVQEELKNPIRKVTQGTLEAQARDNLFKKDEKEEKDQAKKKEM